MNKGSIQIANDWYEPASSRIEGDGFTNWPIDTAVLFRWANVLFVFLSNVGMDLSNFIAKAYAYFM